VSSPLDRLSSSIYTGDAAEAFRFGVLDQWARQAS
jgi:hypothetical protein